MENVKHTAYYIFIKADMQLVKNRAVCVYGSVTPLTSGRLL